jgi:preprotein translocase SecE subunit
MTKFGETIERIKGFFRDTTEEVKRCNWPEGPELVQSTLVVIFSMVLLGVFVGVCDFVLVFLLKLITSAI